MPCHSIRLADAWLEKHARVKLKPTAVVEYERMIDADLRPCLGEMAAGLITKQDVILKVRDKIAGRGARVHADHVVGMVSRIYSWAIDEEYVENNPAYKVRKAAAGPSVRDRVLTSDELRLFWVGLDKAEMSEPLRLIFRLALLTGQRRSEVAGMRKCEIKHDDRLWILPGDRMENGQTIHGRTKNRRDHIVPLTDAAMDVVSKAIACRGNRSSYFPVRCATAASGTSMEKLFRWPCGAIERRRSACQTCAHTICAEPCERFSASRAFRMRWPTAC